MNVVLLAGGVGGAKMAEGLAAAVGRDLSVIVNTGDDLELHGLAVWPDHDTVAYTLAGLDDEVRGWGIRGETWTVMDRLEELGEWRRRHALLDVVLQRAERGSVEALHAEVEPLVDRSFPEAPLPADLHGWNTATLQQAIDRPLGELEVLGELFRAEKVGQGRRVQACL